MTPEIQTQVMLALNIVVGAMTEPLRKRIAELEQKLASTPSVDTLVAINAIDFNKLKVENIENMVATKIDAQLEGAKLVRFDNELQDVINAAIDNYMENSDYVDNDGVIDIVRGMNFNIEVSRH